MVVVGYRIMTFATVTVPIFQNDMESKNKNTTTVTFHLAFTTPAFTKLNQRCLESIFYFHPTAHVILHSNSEHGIHTTGSTTATEPHVLEPIRQLLERGYRIDIQPYSAAHVLQRAMTRSHSIVNVTLATEWMARIATNYSQEKYWYSNESNLLRLCLLYVDGGIYMDTLRNYIITISRNCRDSIGAAAGHTFHVENKTHSIRINRNFQGLPQALA